MVPNVGGFNVEAASVFNGEYFNGFITSDKSYHYHLALVFVADGTEEMEAGFYPSFLMKYSDCLMS